VDVDDINDATVLFFQQGGCCLGKEERGLEVRTDEILPFCFAGLRDGGGIKAGGIVDQDIKASPGLMRLFNQCRQTAGMMQVRLQQDDGIFPRGVQFLLQDLRSLTLVPVVQDNIHTFGMQAAGRCGANAMRRTGYEYNPILQHACGILCVRLKSTPVTLA